MVSQGTAAALAQELDRRSKIAVLDRYLWDLNAELGPISSGEHDAARRWADEALGDPTHPGPDQASRAG